MRIPGPPVGPTGAEATRAVQYKWMVLSNTTVATLMAAIDTNIVLISLPTIGRQLPGTDTTTLLWILIGYSHVTAVV
ncbi:permease, multidrug efflux, partial [mine drainage metagenome]